MSDGKAKTVASIVRPEEWGDEAQRLREEEDVVLEAGGFESGGDNLWAKEGVFYGRRAALQKARMK